MSDELVVSEVFGPTFQGEGPSGGRLALFVRLGRCNLDCSWCDTPYTWDWEHHDPAAELHPRAIDDVVAELDAMGAGGALCTSRPLLVVTGGEPLLQQQALPPLLAAARARGWRVEVETNGTIVPSAAMVALVDGWNVSPKLGNAGITVERRLRPTALQALVATGRAVAKFVASGPADLDEVAEVVGLAGFREVWVMPEARDAETLARALAELAPAVLSRGWNLSNRLHVQLWGDTRGV